MVVIIDYGVGNLSSVQSAFKRIGLDTIISRDITVIKKAKAIVLPGVGTFYIAMKHLKEYGLIDVLNDCKKLEIPILGICLGMQVLFEEGFEVEQTKGLGFLKGSVKKIVTDQKIPHMGWNQLHIINHHPITKYIKQGQNVYFVHSYMASTNQEQLISFSDYGSCNISAIVASKNVVGCQFHPEKSGIVGMNILRGFKEMIK